MKERTTFSHSSTNEQSRKQPSIVSTQENKIIRLSLATAHGGKHGYDFTTFVPVSS